MDLLGPILERKRRESVRRLGHLGLWREALHRVPIARAGAADAVERLRRGSSRLPRVIAEIKHSSPSAGVIRQRRPGAVARIAQAYERGGAAAVSVLCDGPGFSGSVLDVRRAAAAASVPLLFKEFVLDPIQVSLARAVGARLVLLLVRALEPSRLGELVDEVMVQGLCPVVEAASEAELDVAHSTRATVIGVNARDLSTFRVDTTRALALVDTIDSDRVAVAMSGIATADDLARVRDSRADAVLIGESLMRAESPGDRLAELLRAAG